MGGDVYVVGYPRSGNTWLARLLGDALNSPVTGMRNAKPLAEEGADRPGNYVVRQLHLKARDSADELGFAPDPYTANLSAWDGERVAIILRDPRDVAVSAMHYWDMPDLRSAIQAIGQGLHPTAVHGAIQEFYADWSEIADRHSVRTIWVAYEELLTDTQAVLERALRYMQLESVWKLEEVIARQSFERRKREITDDLPYGKNIQHKHLRKGVAGDWRGYFHQADGHAAQQLFGDMLWEHGYINSTGWWRQLPP